MTIQVERAHGLEALGIVRSGRVHWNLGTAALYEEALRRSEGHLAAEGPLVCKTGQHTGRSPNDKFVVKEPTSEKHVHWGAVNRPIDEAKFDQLHKDMMAHLQDKELYVLDAWAGTDPAFRLPIRVVNEFAWHNLFARNMFLPENDPQKRTSHRPEFTVIDAPHFKSDPARHGTRSDVFIFVHFGRKLVLIGGTHYAGEIKKSIFTILNYTLPLQGVLSMHCSANIGAAGDTALFFGLSGTGKTTLSSDPERRLIGDDEHGWSDTGVFNFEGGCYAKVIKLSQEAEPQIYGTTRRFGTILENVAIDPDTRALNLDDASMTENPRGSMDTRPDFSTAAAAAGRSPADVLLDELKHDEVASQLDAISHLGALDFVYSSIVADHRQAIDKLEQLDLVTQDLLIEQSEQLEQFQWFVRAHLESSTGSLATAGAATEEQAARKATTG